MSKLNKDILFLTFEELQDNSKSLFSCLMVNRLWCETVIPILWRNPWCYNNIKYNNKSSLFTIIASYLLDDIKEFITNQEIQLPLNSNQPLLFDYFSFCRSINIIIINNIISIGSNLAYNQFHIQQIFYFFIIKKCSELKYFDMRSIKHQIFYFPEAMVRLESLCELRCDTSIDSSYFYGISRSCRYIQKLIIDNIDPKPNDGIVKLIETQKNLKYFEWKDNFENHYLTKDPYEEIFLALEKKANDLNFLKVHFQYVEGIDCTLFQNILSKFYKLKILIIDDYLYFTEEQLKQLKIQTYNELEILNIEYNKLNVISSIIENSGKHLKKIFFNPYDTIDCEFNDNFNGSSLNFIRKIYENCPLIEYLSIAFSPSKKHFDEFEKLLKICQNLKSILLVILDSNGGETNEKILENGEELLKVLTRSASINLKEIRFYDDFKFSLKSLENFFENWKNRPSLSILTNDLTYMEEDYVELINRYKNNGVIKDFDSNSDEICYHFYSTII